MQESTVLIVTQPGDVHAYAIEAALREKGANVLVWYTTQFPSVDSESICMDGSHRLVEIDSLLTVSPSLDVDSITTVWCRRPALALNEEQIHPSDLRFAEKSCQELRQALMEMLAPKAFWVNSHYGRWRSRNKILQQQVAVESGLEIPRSLYTNDPGRVRHFIRERGGVIAFKPLYGLPWKSEDTMWMPYTQELREEQLVDDELLRAAPGIYQELVPKAFELRVTIMGNSIFSAKIDSQSTEYGRIDWRRANEDLVMQPFELPGPVAEASLRLMRKLGLAFGCIDFIVTPQGDFIFLEVNQMGQFLFVELKAGLPVADAFADLLLSGSEDFVWRPSAKMFDYKAVQASIWEYAQSEMNRFIPVPELCWPENEA